jgi:hypothetical protein
MQTPIAVRWSAGPSCHVALQALKRTEMRCTTPARVLGAWEGEQSRSWTRVCASWLSRSLPGSWSRSEATHPTLPPSSLEAARGRVGQCGSQAQRKTRWAHHHPPQPATGRRCQWYTVSTFSLAASFSFCRRPRCVLSRPSAPHLHKMDTGLPFWRSCLLAELTVDERSAAIAPFDTLDPVHCGGLRELLDQCHLPTSSAR